MRAAVFRGVRNVVVEQVPDPECGPRDVMIAVKACGICGSDLHWYVRGGPAVGTIMGHEFAGEVIALGAEVPDLNVGDRVAVNPLCPCGTCARCSDGEVNLCWNMRNDAGAFADRLVVRDAIVGGRVFRLPDNVSLDEGAALEPLAVAVRAVRLSQASLREPTVEVGLGAIGLCVLQVLKARGAQQVVAVDVSPARLALANRLGADHVIDASSEDAVAALRARFGTARLRHFSFADVPTVFECSGARRVLEQVLDGMVRAGGTVVVLAIYEEPPTPDLNVLVRKELRVIGSFAYQDPDFAEAFDLLASGRVDLSSLITHRVALADIGAAYRQALDKAHTVKVLVIP